MLNASAVEAYRRDGFIVVPDVLSSQEIAELRATTDAFVAGARGLAAHTEVYDLEPSHRPDAPRVRRIKQPHKRHPVYEALVAHPRILAVLRQLIGPAIRFDESKLNMKEPGYGAAVEWHQDWAFYPQTNDDLCAVGIMMDDCALENGPLLCLAGSHRGPVYDHHADGAFCGAMDPRACGVDVSKAMPLTGPAGSITVHHVRTLHGSAVNVSAKPRRVLFHQYAAADAFPLLASHQTADWDTWRSRVICGDPDLVAPRMTAVPVRLPLPPPRHAGSIYEIQRDLKASYFGAPAAVM